MQRTSMSFNSWFGALANPRGSWQGFGILILIWILSLVFDTPMIQILALYLDFDGAKNSHVLGSPHFGLRRMLAVPDWGVTSWSWFGYGHWSLMEPCSKFQLSIFNLNVQRSSMSFKSLFGALEDTGGSWLGFCILTLIWIRSLFFGTPMFQVLALYLDFEGAKNIHVL